MKRFFCVLLAAVVVCLVFTGCAKYKATIVLTYTDGSTETVTAKEMRSLYNDNEVAYREKYVHVKTIEVIDKIRSLRFDTYGNVDITTENWCGTSISQLSAVAGDLREGQVIKISGKMDMRSHAQALDIVDATVTIEDTKK